MKNFKMHIFGQLLLVITLGLLFPINGQAMVYTLDLALSGQNEVPPNSSTATGILMGTYDDATNVLSFNLMFNGLSAPATAAHFHGPAAPGVNGPVVIPFAGFPAGATFGNYSNAIILTPEQESQLLCGMWYVNIHTVAFPAGEIRSQLKEAITSGNISTFELALTGQKEVPVNPTAATGILTGTYDAATKVLSFNLMFNGLLAPTTAAHFHGPASPAANGPVQITLVGFPVGVFSGIYSNTFVLTPLQEAQLLGGMWYVNIHTAVFPAGEIRSQLTEGTLTGNCAVSTIPIANWALLLGGLLIGSYAFFMIRRRS